MTDHTAIGDEARRGRMAGRVDRWEEKAARWFGRGAQMRAREGLGWLAGWFARAPLVSCGGFVVTALLLVALG